MSRLLLSTGMVAAAWALAITGLIFVGDAKAEAAWTKTGLGTAAAKTITFVTPTGLKVDSVGCNNGGQGYSIGVSWSYSGATPPGFEIYVTTNGSGSPTVLTASTSPLPSTALSAKPTSVSVQAVAGRWHSTRTAAVNTC